MTIQIQYFHDSLNVVGVLAPVREFFSARFTRIPITCTEENQMMAILPTELLSLIFEIKLIKKHHNTLKYRNTL